MPSQRISLDEEIQDAYEKAMKEGRVWVDRATERDMGEISADIRNIKETIREIRALIGRNEERYTQMIQDVEDRLSDKIEKLFEDLEGTIDSIEKKMQQHLDADVPVGNMVTHKVGKWFITLIVVLATMAATAILTRMAQPFIDIFRGSYQQVPIERPYQYYNSDQIENNRLDNQRKYQNQKNQKSQIYDPVYPLNNAEPPILFPPSSTMPTIE